MKSFGGNFGTRPDGIYGVSKMWRVYLNMEARLKRKIVHSYPLFTWNWTKITTITHIDISNMKMFWRGYLGRVTKLAWKRGSCKSCIGKPLNVSWRRQRLMKLLLGVANPCNQMCLYCKGYHVTIPAWKRGWGNITLLWALVIFQNDNLWREYILRID